MTHLPKNLQCPPNAEQIPSYFPYTISNKSQLYKIPPEWLQVIEGALDCIRENHYRLKTITMYILFLKWNNSTLLSLTRTTLEHPQGNWFDFCPFCRDCCPGCALERPGELGPPPPHTPDLESESPGMGSLPHPHTQLVPINETKTTKQSILPRAGTRESWCSYLSPFWPWVIWRTGVLCLYLGRLTAGPQQVTLRVTFFLSTIYRLDILYVFTLLHKL